MRAAAVYIRISSDRGGTRAGVRRQLEDCRSWAERNGTQVAEVYEDNDVSAYRGKPRPAYRRMFDDIKAGVRDGVIVWHNDRLHRNTRELEDFIDLVEATGIAVATVTSGDYDLTTTTGRAMARIACALSRLESEDKSRRIKRQQLQAAQEGRRSGGGTRAYGFQPGHRKVIPKESAVVREAARRILAGEPLRSVTRDLNDRRIPTVTGKPWSSTVLRTILTSGRISGQREHLGEIVAAGDWPAIVTPAQTARLRTILLDPDRRTNRVPRRYPLTGLVYCGKCGARLVARPRDDGERRYFCAKGPGFSGCGGIAILAEPLERLIAEAVLHRLDSPKLPARCVPGALGRGRSRCRPTGARAGRRRARAAGQPPWPGTDQRAGVDGGSQTDRRPTNGCSQTPRQPFRRRGARRVRRRHRHSPVAMVEPRPGPAAGHYQGRAPPYRREHGRAGQEPLRSRPHPADLAGLSEPALAHLRAGWRPRRSPTCPLRTSEGLVHGQCPLPMLWL